MLYRPQEFEPLTDGGWDERAVREAIERIVADADEAYRREPLWPPPPDSPLGPGRPEPSLYAGAPGVLLALDALQRRGHAESALDLPAVAIEALEAWRTEPAVFPGLDLPQRESSLLLGEAGVLYVAWSLTHRPDLADDLHARVLANVDEDEVDELMWGTAGTLVIAADLLERTGEPRWRDACRDSAEALLARRDADGLWTQRRFKDTRSLGPVHGAVGNVHALLRVLDGDENDRLESETSAMLARFAHREVGLANWPPEADGQLEHHRTGEIKVQWCHGAPLTWQAGAHRAGKGAGICHGTSGNGYALLAAFARTGDELWLERARRFAVHALGQAEREQPTYSLFVGAVGVALFASDCLDAECRYPLLG
jgi:hypothetical protein